MNIAVIAANGRSGQAFVKAALAAGHTIVAGVHGESRLPSHPNLRTIECDATNSAQVGELIAGQDAVVSFIGHTPHSTATVQTDAMNVLVSSMQQHNVRRLVSLTGTGVRQPGDNIPLIDRLMTVGIRVIDPKRVKDGIEHANVLGASSLEWTILRVLKLQNVTPSPFTLKAHGPTKWFVSREDVARAALEVLEHHSFIREMPILSKA